MKKLLCVHLLLTTSFIASAQEGQSQIPLDANYDLKGIREVFSTHLKDELIPFWTIRTPDKEYGGFLIFLDPEGNQTGETDKYIITQLRMLWTFALAVKLGMKDADYKQLLDSGLKFVKEKMWDKEYCGYYWQVKREGAPVDVIKKTVAQCYALYVFSDIYLMIGEEKYLDEAKRAYSVLQSNCYDPIAVGYRTEFTRDWNYPADPKINSTWDGGIHMHVLLGMAKYYKALPSQSTRNWLELSYRVVVEKMMDLRTGAFPLVVHEDWKNDESTSKTMYGHTIELAWYLDEAAESLGGKYKDAWLPCAQKLAGNVLTYGTDGELGGIYLEGPYDGESTCKNKYWWVQQEAMVAFLTLYRETKDKKYLDAFMKTYRFSWKYQKDKFDWNAVVDREGKVIDGNKGYAWKCSFHSARCMYKCISLIDEILAGNK